MVAKHYPVKTNLSFDIEPDEDTALSIEYVSLPRELSAHNRRLYRMNKHYAVNGGMVTLKAKEGFQDVSNIRIEINTLGDTWFERQAYQEGFKQWLEMKDSVDTPNDLKGRWNDWRVKMLPNQNDSPSALLDSAPSSHYGSFDFSDYTFYKSDDSVGTQIAYAGSMQTWNENETQFSLLEAYKQMLMKPPVQDLPETDATQTLAASPYVRFDTIDTNEAGVEIMKDEIEEGANPPYSREYMPPSLECVYEGRLPSTGSTVHLPSFIAPLGYIQIVLRIDDSQETFIEDMELNLSLSVAHGDYKGVAAI